MRETIGQIIAKAKKKDCCDSCRKGAKKCPCDKSAYTGISKIDMTDKYGGRTTVNLLASVLTVSGLKVTTKGKTVVANKLVLSPIRRNGVLQENGVPMSLVAYYRTVKAANVADKIIEHIGGNKALFMLGAKNLLRDTNSITMDLPRNASGANKLKIELNTDDTYTLHFMKYIPSKLELKTLKKLPNVMVANLREILSKELQMRLALASKSKKVEASVKVLKKVILMGPEGKVTLTLTQQSPIKLLMKDTPGKSIPINMAKGEDPEEFMKLAMKTFNGRKAFLLSEGYKVTSGIRGVGPSVMLSGTKNRKPVKFTIAVKYDSDYSEYRIEVRENGNLDEDKTYRTDDQDDALKTKELIIKDLKTKGFTIV